MEPALGDIVIYRNKDGVDMPGIVTGLVKGYPLYLHLKLFPPPGAAADLMDPYWGAAPNSGKDELARQMWRWPEHARPREADDSRA